MPANKGYSNPSSTGHQFSQVPRADIPRSSFDRSFAHKSTFDSGLLIPFLVDEGLPGDTVTVNTSAYARLATPIYPIMDNMFMDFHFFAVPIRLVFDNWQKLNGEQDNPGDSTDYIMPVVNTPPGGFPVGSLFDYMGVPTDVDVSPVRADFLRAYQLIWDEWFRDQNLQQSLSPPKDDGPDLSSRYEVQRRGKRHDYFTSSLPWPQKGQSVDLPLGDVAPVLGIGGAGAATSIIERGIKQADGTTITTDALISTDTGNADAIRLAVDNDTSQIPQIYADLSTATASTINQLRQAFQLQRLLERDARGGTRYTEVIRAHFGVTSPDARLQRPEYLGGSSQPVVINPVAQTSSTDATSPQANLSAVGTAAASGIGFTKSFTEHVIIIGLVSFRADLTYQQGLNRMWSRSTRYDFYWPALSHIGEQAVLNKEIYADGTPDDELAWGYQERYAEYRYKPSQISGLFRSSAAQSLDAWHLAQDFQNRPALNEEFIEENPPVDRVIAVPTEPHWLFDSYSQMRFTRPMPLYGVPGFIDHF